MVRVSCRARTEHSRTVCRLCLCLCIVQVRTVESLTSEGLHELIDINTGRFRIVLGFKILNETKQHMTRIIKVKQTDAWALSPWRQHGQTSGSQPNYARLIVPRTQSWQGTQGRCWQQYPNAWQGFERWVSPLVASSLHRTSVDCRLQRCPHCLLHSLASTVWIGNKGLVGSSSYFVSTVYRDLTCTLSMHTYSGVRSRCPYMYQVMQNPEYCEGSRLGCFLGCPPRIV